MNNNRKKPTIRDVAEKVGVHHSTVSRALNPEQRNKISPAVIREIEKAAKSLGYLPNIAASQLRRNRSFAVGVLIPDITNPIFPPIIRGIQDIADQAGYTVITANTDDDVDKERDAVNMMRGRSIEGMIIATARLDDPIVEECIGNDIPLVLVHRTVSRDGVNAVIIDEGQDFRLDWWPVIEELLADRSSGTLYVFQDPNLVPVLTAYENVEVPLWLFRMKADTMAGIHQDTFAHLAEEYGGEVTYLNVMPEIYEHEHLRHHAGDLLGREVHHTHDQPAEDDLPDPTVDAPGARQ